MTTITATPERTLEQRFEALRRANRIRSDRAELKRDLKARQLSLVALLASPPELIRTMKVINLLLAAPKIGSVKANRALRMCQISPSKTVGGLTFRQRLALLDELHLAHGLTVPEPVRAARKPKPGARLICATCRLPMLVEDPDGMCGFCREETPA